jgi:hypothetical protein
MSRRPRVVSIAGIAGIAGGACGRRRAEKFIEEPRKVVADSILPSAWYEYSGSPQFTFYLVNGSQHVLLGVRALRIRCPGATDRA